MLIKNLTKDLSKSNDLRKIATYITVFIRNHINQSVAASQKINGIHSPAPKRVKLLNTNIIGNREVLLEELYRLLKSNRLSSDFLKSIKNNYSLNLFRYKIEREVEKCVQIG